MILADLGKMLYICIRNVSREQTMHMGSAKTPPA